ncbi:MAG TPA: hypothetical protein VFN67_10375 [Polyangiales bacterium]|nr:hypothetical protein [Polyangiales bacterium]
MRIGFVVAVVCLASACALEAPEDLSNEEIGGLAQPILNGVIGSQRGIVGLTFVPNNCGASCNTPTCTGAIIADGIIMTAGHCLREAGWGSGGAADTLTGEVAITTLDPSTNTHRCLTSSDENIEGICNARSAGDVVVATGVIHPRAIPNSAQFDIGIFRTGMSWTGFGVDHRFIVRMALSSTRDGEVTTALKQDDDFIAVGFGFSGRTLDPEGLKTDPDPVWVDEVTNSAATGMVLRNNADSVRMCRGDSGSPAFILSPGDVSISAGVLSTGSESLGSCSPEGTPQMWTMLQTSADFIQSTMRRFYTTCTTADLAIDSRVSVQVLECN